MMPVCWIVGAGEFDATRFAPAPGDFVIAADGGLKYLDALGVKPDLVLGDFDSLGRVPAGGNVLRYPPEKDFSKRRGSAVPTSSSTAPSSYPASLPANSLRPSRFL